MDDADAFRALRARRLAASRGRVPDAFGALTAQVTEPLLDAVGAGPRCRVLDVATGPGYVASAAARRGADVVGVDFARAMVEQAQRRYPDVEFREGDAEALPFTRAGGVELAMPCVLASAVAR